jgi:hypothetical protein
MVHVVWSTLHEEKRPATQSLSVLLLHAELVK